MCIDGHVKQPRQSPPVPPLRAPPVCRVAVLWDANDAAMNQRFEEIQMVAPKLGVGLQPQPVRTPEDFDGAFAVFGADEIPE